MEVNYWKEKSIIENPHNLDAREVYHHKYAQIMHMQLKPGQIVEPHSSPVDIVFVILEGEVEIQIDKEKQIVKTDAIIHSPANLLHGLENCTKDFARIMVIKTPSPKKF
jgi:quercetin dioxygenase-like cupin family protein